MCVFAAENLMSAKALQLEQNRAKMLKQHEQPANSHILYKHQAFGGGWDSAAELVLHHCNAAVHCGKLACERARKLTQSNGREQAMSQPKNHMERESKEKRRGGRSTDAREKKTMQWGFRGAGDNETIRVYCMKERGKKELSLKAVVLQTISYITWGSMAQGIRQSQVVGIPSSLWIKQSRDDGKLPFILNPLDISSDFT